MKNKYILLIFICITYLNSCFVYASNSYHVGYSSNSEPVQYTNTHNEASGIAIEILKYLGKDYNYIFNFTPLNNSSDNQETLNISNLHSLIDTNIYTQSSVPYYSMKLSLIGSIYHKTHSNMKVGVLDYITISDNNILSKLPNAEVYYYTTYEYLIRAFLEGELDFIFLDNMFSNEFLTSDYGVGYQNYPITLDVPLKIYALDSVPSETIIALNVAINELNSNDINNIILDNSMIAMSDMNLFEIVNTYNYAEIIKTTITFIVLISTLVVCFFTFYRKHLNKITFYDKVTGFFTEYKFNLEASKILKKAEPNEYSIVAVDIDNFQYVNEVYGFETGTYVLTRFGEHLKTYYQNATLMTRIHSDNFLILIKSDDLLTDNQNVKLNFNEETFASILGDYSHFYTSKGVYAITDPSQTLATIVGCVNLARVSGKSTYGNTSIVFTETMHKKRATQNKILSTMEQALKDKEFEVFYQPKIFLKDQSVQGAEALVRWIVKDGAPIFPDDFIPLFEKNRYITKLDFYVFEEVCIFISEHGEEIGNCVLSVNLSTITLLQKDLLHNLLELLLKYNISIEAIELEVTESAFVDNLELIMSQIHMLKNAGFSIALDDFGSGISSLNQLKNMELDVLKLDKAFLSDSLNQDKGILIVDNVILLAKKLNLKIVAEGVETIDDVNLLTKLGCDIAQGYYFARPVRKSEFLEFLSEK